VSFPLLSSLSASLRSERGSWTDHDSGRRFMIHFRVLPLGRSKARLLRRIDEKPHCPACLALHARAEKPSRSLVRLAAFERPASLSVSVFACSSSPSEPAKPVADPVLLPTDRLSVQPPSSTYPASSRLTSQNGKVCPAPSTSLPLWTPASRHRTKRSHTHTHILQGLDNLPPLWRLRQGRGRRHAYLKQGREGRETESLAPLCPSTLLKT